MKKLLILSLLALPLLGFSQKFVYGLQGELLLPTGDTKDFYDLGTAANVELGVKLLKVELLLESGVGALFTDTDTTTISGDKFNNALFIPVLGKVRYSLFNVGVRPYISLAAGLLNSFDVAGEEESTFAVKPGVGIELLKVLKLQAAYLYAEEIGQGIPLRTFNLSAAFSIL